ncbi:39S ribosomal protein L27, mitochondrial-like [Falco naumanni]|uniref:39S ribosomal protein L27, mitochondrial-like n=1 Tax=Falco naumanni TaxID=148594 RepID=UPI001ADE7580|nr:39S ribosomal protein L27, mitochondrial-like [Falco naumanni]
MRDNLAREGEGWQQSMDQRRSRVCCLAQKDAFLATELWRSSPPRITTIRRTGGTLPGPGTIGMPWTRGVLTTPQTSLVAVRCASKKTGGSYKNVGGRSPGKRYGFKKVDGEFVHAGNILATQRLMRWHPGAHVGMGHNKTLYALEDGIVRYTKEVYVPLPCSSESREAICCLPKGAVLYKTFINVIPVTEVGSFKLVTML